MAVVASAMALRPSNFPYSSQIIAAESGNSLQSG
jgi:hypothetical protein